MKEPPRSKSEPILGRGTLRRIAAQGVLIASVGLGAYFLALGPLRLPTAAAQTTTFVAVTAAQLLASSMPAPNTVLGLSAPPATRTCGRRWGSQFRSRWRPSESRSCGRSGAWWVLPGEAWWVAAVLAPLPLVLPQSARMLGDRPRRRAATAWRLAS